MTKSMLWGVPPRSVVRCLAGWAVALVTAHTTVPAAEPAAAPPKGAAPAAAKEAGITAGIEAASNTYSDAFNAHDLIALADQCTTDAELVEGG